MNTWSPEAHRLFCHWKAKSFPTQKLNILVSGGADSIALLELMTELQPALGLSFRLIHFHHGGDSKYRFEAANFLKETCQRMKLELLLFQSAQELVSEAQMRNFRREKLQALWLLDKQNLFLTAHHQQDLLETRLIRLIRGAGSQGLRAIQDRKGAWIRPLLSFQPEELRAYLAAKNRSWLQDPSNHDPRYFRNWVRHNWLTQLEVYRPGSQLRLGRSLELCSVATQELKLIKSESGIYIERPRFLMLSLSERERWVARVLWNFKIRDYSQGQVFEIRKRLDNSKKEHTFSLSGLDWNINAKRILASLNQAL